MRQIIASLDIGSSKIKLVVAELKEEGVPWYSTWRNSRGR